MLHVMATRIRERSDPGLAAIFAELQLRAQRGMGIASLGEFAAALDVTKQAVSNWRYLPAERVLEVEHLLGIPREILRPDIYADSPPLVRVSKKRGRAPGSRR